MKMATNVPSTTQTSNKMPNWFASMRAGFLSSFLVRSEPALSQLPCNQSYNPFRHLLSHCAAVQQSIFLLVMMF